MTVPVTPTSVGAEGAGCNATVQGTRFTPALAVGVGVAAKAASGDTMEITAGTT